MYCSIAITNGDHAYACNVCVCPCDSFTAATLSALQDDNPSVGLEEVSHHQLELTKLNIAYCI
jgi:hypothetical protein